MHIPLANAVDDKIRFPISKVQDGIAITKDQTGILGQGVVIQSTTSIQAISNIYNEKEKEFLEAFLKSYLN